jgi:zinc D-Ala-D-Ala carboxypeptidase
VSIHSPKNIASNDIPQAQRQPTEISLAEIEKAFSQPIKPPKRRRKPLLSLLVVAGLVGLTVWQWSRLSTGFWALKASIAEVNAFQSPPDNPSASETPDRSADGSADGSAPEVTAAADKGSESEEPEAEANAELETGEAFQGNREASQKNRPETLLNHRRYDEAPQQSLIPLSPNSEVTLQPVAQASVNAMVAKAKAEGVQLGVASGFRSIEDQNYLYFEVKAERGESAKTRAAVSAPPGYSEHHTGYAVDLMDESRPQTHLEESFETTPAYQWLKQNAAFFNFEMSFPKNNESNVAYEPWHWRYVGDQDSLETFYQD